MGLSYLGSSSPNLNSRRTPRRVPAVTPHGPSGPLKHTRAHRYHRLSHQLQDPIRMVIVCSVRVSSPRPSRLPHRHLLRPHGPCARRATQLPIAPAGGGQQNVRSRLAFPSRTGLFFFLSFFPFLWSLYCHFVFRPCPCKYCKLRGMFMTGLPLQDLGWIYNARLLHRLLFTPTSPLP